MTTAKNVSFKISDLKKSKSKESPTPSGGVSKEAEQNNFNSLPQKTHLFTFNSKFLQEFCEVISEGLKVDFETVGITTVVAMGFVCGYKGFERCQSYSLNLSQTGAGKSQTYGVVKQLLQPIWSVQAEKHKKAFDEWIQLKKSERDLKPFRSPFALIEDMTSPQMIFSNLHAEPSLLYAFDEIPSDFDLLKPTLLRLFANSKVTPPAYKTQAIEKPELDCRFTLMGSSTVDRITGLNELFHGGFLPRCLIIFSTSPAKAVHPEDMGEHAEFLGVKQKELGEFLSFLGSVEKKEIKKPRFQELRAYREYLADVINEQRKLRLKFGRLYTRLGQHLQHIINIFHLLECWESGVYTQDVRFEIVQNAIDFIEMMVIPQIKNLEDYISGHAQEESDEVLIEKGLEWLKTQSLPISFREFYRKAFNGDRERAEVFIERGIITLSKSGKSSLITAINEGNDCQKNIKG